MARFSATSISLLAYILVMAVGGIAAKSWHKARADRAVYTPVFRVPAPPTGTVPGEMVTLRYENYRLGNHAVCEVGNLRLATPTKSRYRGGGGSNDFTSAAPGDSGSGGLSRYGFTFSNIPVNVVDCHVEIGGGRYPVLGPKRLLIVDAQGNVVTDVALELSSRSTAPAP